MHAADRIRPLRDRPLPPLARRVLGSAVLEALATPHGMSRYLEQLSPAWSLDPTRATVRDVVRAPGAVTLTLRRAAPAAPHRAGQHVRLAVEIDGRSHTRCYSITDAEGADPQDLTLTVRTHAHGLVSRHLERVAPGDALRVSEPAGRFALPAERPDRILLVGAGSGITPLLSMLRTLVREGHRGRVSFLHYARGADAVLHGEDLAALARSGADVQLATIFTRERGAPRSGHLTGDHLAEVDPDWRDASCFACGPVPMLEVLSDLFEAEGLGERFHREQFTAAAPAVLAASAQRGAGARGATRFAASGVTVPNDGRTLLDQAEAAGLAPSFGCRMGICHTCTCRVASGSVRDVRTGEVTDATDGEVQLCIAAAVDDVEIDL